MILPRLIPVLLLDGPGLVKTRQFGRKVYIGDPCNTVRIYNEKQVDEIVLLDISCRGRGGIQFDRIQEIVSEAFMPLAYGGGIESVDQVERLLQIGIEKVVLRTEALRNPALVTDVARRFGSSATVVCLDVSRKGAGWAVRREGGSEDVPDLAALARKLEDCGAGELILQSVDRDGTMEGFDLEAIHLVAPRLGIPVVACGGAGSMEDFRKAVQAGSSAAGAGAFFVFVGPLRAVLISYPEPGEILQAFGGGK